ncbi:hypothetical protein V1508DRAFT_425718 [Lipomyces doorenjongii]|uniref:uncharacterized protein n=1 Tax=Lipomyces doorenjongii TaxID=383834 RepID=UPI0034CDEFFF
METTKVNEQDTVLDIFSRHYNCHPLIPDQNGSYQSAEYIHRSCALGELVSARSVGPMGTFGQ